MTSKAKREQIEKDRIAAMTKEQMRDEFVKTLVGSIMPLIEKVVERRVEQWFDVITEAAGVGMHPKKQEPA